MPEDGDDNVAERDYCEEEIAEEEADVAVPEIPSILNPGKMCSVNVAKVKARLRARAAEKKKLCEENKLRHRISSPSLSEADSCCRQNSKSPAPTPPRNSSKRARSNSYSRRSISVSSTEGNVNNNWAPPLIVTKTCPDDVPRMRVDMASPDRPLEKHDVGDEVHSHKWQKSVSSGSRHKRDSRGRTRSKKRRKSKSRSRSRGRHQKHSRHHHHSGSEELQNEDETHRMRQFAELMWLRNEAMRREQALRHAEHMYHQAALMREDLHRREGDRLEEALRLPPLHSKRKDSNVSNVSLSPRSLKRFLKETDAIRQRDMQSQCFLGDKSILPVNLDPENTSHHSHSSSFPSFSLPPLLPPWALPRIRRHASPPQKQRDGEQKRRTKAHTSPKNRHGRSLSNNDNASDGNSSDSFILNKKIKKKM